ncbi:hypothetical protein [Paraconexibacter sp.]|uniref:hypothetical protein n=1 Tax=Paraconexibacter sp. TaxID=2949640 RepID=UPI003567A636
MMPRPIRHTAAMILLALLLVGAGASTASAKPLVGIADQKADMFTDPRFLDLGIRTARVYVPYDVTTNPRQLVNLDRWMGAAKAAGVAPLVTMERSSDRRKRGRAPSVTTYRRQVRKLRRRYPFARAYSVWNEANHGGQPLSRRPDLAARYYRVLVQECKGCTILAADLLDQPNMTSWATRFVKALGRQPKYWGLHNYLDANRLSTKGTRKLLRAVEGQVWLTETGGVVARRNGSKVKFKGTGVGHARAVTKFVLTKLAKVSPRISRIYLYHWNSQTKMDSWDSAFIAFDGSERPSLDVLRSYLGRPLGPPKGPAA